MRSIAPLVAGLIILVLLGGVPVGADGAGTLRIGAHLDSSVITPYNYVGALGNRQMGLVYDSLLYLDADNMPQLWLAETADLSADGLQWTFTLHQGVTWHDEVPFTANDVKFTFDYFGEHLMGRFSDPIKRAVASVEVLDDYTVVIHLNQVDPAFRFDLADILIIPQHLWKDVEDPLGYLTIDKTVGTGPYMLVEYRPSELYKFEANPRYFKGEPYFDEIIMPVIVDSTTLFTALKIGEIDAVTLPLAPELVAEFEAVEGLDIISGPGFVSSILCLNNDLYPFSLKEFRHALAHAIDLDYLVDVIRLGLGATAIQGYYHPDTPWANHDAASYDGGPDEARAILDGLGFVDADGDGYRETPVGIKMEYTILARSSSPDRVRSAEIISSWFRDIGLNVTAQVVEWRIQQNLMWPEFDPRKGRDYDMGMWGWAALSLFTPWGPTKLVHSDPDKAYQNIVGFESAELDAVIDQMFTAVTDEELADLVFEFQEILAEEAPFISLNYPDVIFAYRPAGHDQWVFRKGETIFDKLSLISLYEEE